MIELDVLPPWADFLNDRRGFIGALELILSLLSFLAVAVGLDKLLFPLLKKLSNKDPIQLTDEGVRFHYRGSHADVRFSDMEKVTKLKESAGFDIHTTNGQVIEISGYADMSIIEQHLKQKLLD
ncbi:MAG: hypothetical protein HWE27_06240 [Gammaproteobacteria bacterium]|nr:hypothetical protein [Gammaproteobacteria bacterium]